MTYSEKTGKPFFVSAQVAIPMGLVIPLSPLISSFRRRRLARKK